MHPQPHKNSFQAKKNKKNKQINDNLRKCYLQMADIPNM